MRVKKYKIIHFTVFPLFRSGEEEELTEKDHLLLEIIGIKESIENEEIGEKSQKKKDEVEQRQRAVEIRAAAMESRKRKQSEDAAGPSSSSSEGKQRLILHMSSNA